MNSPVRALLAATVIALCIPQAARGLSPFEAAAARLDSLRLDPVEGLWSMSPAGGGALFSIIAAPGRPGVFEMRILESPDWRVAENTLCGEVRAAARPGVYDCRMAADPSKSSFAPALSTHTATIELASDGARLIIRPYRRRHRISLRRWLPYFFRISIHEENTRPDDLDGAVRLYPPIPGANPVNL